MMNIVHRAVVVAGLLLFAFAATALQAQWPDSASTNLPIADLSGEQVQAKLALTADGGVYVSWFDNNSGGYDVRLQRLDPEGNELWAHNGVLIADRGFSSTQDYDLDTDTAGNALLTFRDDRLNGTQITATKVSPAGVQLWGATGVQLTNGSEFYAAPKIAGTSDGEVVVAWTNDSVIKLQKLDGSGLAQWGAGVTIPTIGGDSISASDMDASDAGGVIISMVRGFISPKHLHAQKIDSDGNFKWGANPFPVFNTGALQTGNFPQFVPDGAGGAVFTWYSVNAGLQCHAQWIQADRTKAFGSSGAIVSTAMRDRTGPDVAFDAATSQTYVFWREEDFPGMYGVYGQKFGPTGTRLWGDSGVEIVPLTTTEVGQVKAVATSDAAESLWVETQAFNQQTVLATRLNEDGTPAWNPAQAIVSSVVSGKSRLAAAAAGADAFIAVWTDSRTDAGDVYGQRVRPDGTLGNPALPGSVSGLSVDKSFADTLRLNWNASCGTATNYGIYEGTVGNWYDHSLVDCLDDGADLEELLTPSAGNRYFLVVPLDGGVEGSYGQDYLGNERPPGGPSCGLAFNIQPCP